jgi:GAF domain-containing protein
MSTEFSRWKQGLAKGHAGVAYDGRRRGGMPMRVDYDDLRARIGALTAGEDDPVSLMATVACEVHHADDRFDWTGFYRVVAPGLLKIGPYQGGHGCLVIPFERGVCGAAARTGEVQLVPDVELFPGHIACSSSTRSEIVLPVRDGTGRLLGVFDIDSDQAAAFDEADAEGLAAVLGDVFGRLA